MSNNTISLVSKKKHPKTVIILLSCLWVGGIGIGSTAMLNHEFTAVPQANAPLTIPDTISSLDLEDKALTIAIAVHPDCPCTEASLEQLDRLLLRNSENIQIIGLVRANAETIESNSYWQRLEALPNTHPISDPDGKIANQLGARVSGATIAYDANGILRFQGGITASRGHAGSSRGLDTLEAIARQLAPAELCSAPAFGCSLENPTKPSRKLVSSK